MRPCVECGSPYPVPPIRGRGRPRLYCSDRCRWKAAARSKRAVRLAPPLGLAPTREQIAGVLAELLPADDPDAPPARADEELITSVLELQAAAGRLLLIEAQLPARLAGRAGLLAAKVREAIRLTFPGVAT